MLRVHLDEKQMSELVNFKDKCGVNPMRLLECSVDKNAEWSEGESLKRERIGLVLITCGADSFMLNEYNIGSEKLTSG